MSDRPTVVIASLRYEFAQPFRVGAQAAFEWCTDFRPSDGQLLEKNSRRSVRRLSEDTFILTDTTFPKGRPLRIRRLVRLDRPRLAWTNTDLDGPFRHSQYWYQILSDGPGRSHLVFTGHHLLRGPTPLTSSEIRRFTRRELNHDLRLWRDSIGPALNRELA